mmetsp:Transcript_7585/g.16380  ORF Transcript_7585/g.16380 Transcript_7585/m.16380 type:complete len:292 (-) Transcript_7585:346-1221(-)
MNHQSSPLCILLHVLSIMVGTKPSRTSSSNSNGDDTVRHKDATPPHIHKDSNSHGITHPLLGRNADDATNHNNNRHSSSGRFWAVFLLLLLSSRVVVVAEAFQFHVRSGHRIDVYRLGKYNHNHANVLTPPSSTTKHASTVVTTMRDRSASYWFSVGDRVRVVEDVVCSSSSVSGLGSNSNNSKFNLKGRVGTVVETWEKCDVDPTCCCAEQVDTDMAVRVAFYNNKEEENDAVVDDPVVVVVDAGTDVDKGNGQTKNLPAATTTIPSSSSSSSSSSPFYYYFAEEELMKV